MRTCRARGIGTVAVHSEADRTSLHVAEADEAVEIGPAPAAESYLVIPRLIDAAKRTRAEAIHPGYGFLSERAEFAAACDAAGITFIGPSPSAIAMMGDKVRARTAMIAARVPVVPGRDDLSDVADAIAAADAIGFPVMLKASAGGGGKGMRIVRSREGVKLAFEAAQREAIAAFGDGRLFLERAILNARHVEVQVMADRHGTTVHLGERDCSVQRRHQKVIEESPCPSSQMTPRLRDAMGEIATRAAAAIGYVGAGTIEFLLEETAEGPAFYFLEMNTRLQVEHAVTECVTGRDLVWDQIRVASGDPLGFTQAEVVLRGHSVECRIYAEDPTTFLPRPGRVVAIRWPEGGTVRVDAAVTSGSDVSSHYDPLIAKITTWGQDRKAAIAEMRRALGELVIVGLTTNVPLHRRILEEPDFAAGTSVTTRYLDDHPELVVRSDGTIPSKTSEAIAAAVAIAAASSLNSPSQNVADVGSSWRHSARWRR